MSGLTPVYIFFHVPKTGGTTILSHLRQHLDYDKTFVHLGGGGEEYRLKMNLTRWQERPAEERSRARVLAGHHARYGVGELVPGRPSRYLTIHREPAARIVSQYNFQMQRTGLETEFEEWYSSFPRNKAFKMMRKQLNMTGTTDFAPIADVISGMWFVGVTEHLNDDLPHLFRHFGAPSDTWSDQRVATLDREQVDEYLQVPRDQRWRTSMPTLRRMDLTTEWRDRINGDNGRDMKLYELALRRREQTLANLHDD